MDELIEKMARAFVVEIVAQEGMLDNIQPADVKFDDSAGCQDGLFLPYIDQSFVECGAIAKAIIAAIQETHAIVPKEPTEAQLMAAYGLGSDYDIYKAMLEASPKL